MVLSRAVRVLDLILSSVRYKVEGNSMFPTLAHAQEVLATNSAQARSRLCRGDVVVVRHPAWADQAYIKRIVGLPDEDLRLDGGRVYLGGQLLEERYLDAGTRQRVEYDREWWLGPDEHFVLGDNRSDSQDSRAFGPISREMILGRVWLRYQPLSAWGLI
jgi:signal peptidase I